MPKQIKNKFKDYKKQQGVALVLALVILFVIMVSATALGKIILSGLQITLNSSNSLRAFYSADSGIEKVLYYSKYNKIRGENWPIGSLENETFSLYGSSDSQFYFTEISTSTPGFYFYNVTTSSPAHIDIIDVAGNLPAVIDWDPSGLNHQYELDWSITDCFPDHASDRLQISSYYFDSSDLSSDPFQVSVDTDVAVCNCTYNGNPTISNACDTFTKTIFDTKFYRFAFRPLDDTVASLSFNVWETSATNYLASSTANLYAVVDGSYKNTEHRLSVQIPETAPISDIFSFAIFSEEVIRKE